MAKFTKVGVVRKSTKPGKENSPPFITLGNAQAKDKKYRTHCEIRVVDDDGNQLAYVKDGILFVQDPRENPNMTEERAAKIPDWLLKEIYIVEQD